MRPRPAIAHRLVAALHRRGWTITTAESCTVGLVVAALGAVPGVSAVLREALVAYAPDCKATRLDVPPAALDDVVSRACAEAMATGAVARTGADVAIATTGLAGPGGSPGLPVGTVWIAVALPMGMRSRLLHLRGGRRAIQMQAACAALTLAWQAVHDVDALKFSGR